jgi:hypothetical protein
MKQLTSTKFFRSLREASQTGIDVELNALQNEYDEFVLLLFSQNSVLSTKSEFRNTLNYTCVELSALTDVSGKKCDNLYQKSQKSNRITHSKRYRLSASSENRQIEMDGYNFGFRGMDLRLARTSQPKRRKGIVTNAV